ncbi:MAG: lysoplasmalogenase [Clostridiales bacterium]|nr:lysoplasmalogenase [Clostridiales bacterium]
MVLYALLLIIDIISLVVFLRFRLQTNSVKACMLKGFTSIVFVAMGAAAAGHALGQEKFAFALFILVGLVGGLMGDVWLDLKWIYPSDNDSYTFAGFGAFMLGHLVYIAALLIYYADWSKPLYVIIPIIIAALVAGGMLVLEKPMKMNYGKFKVITVIYSAILTYMTFLSGSLALMDRFETRTTVIMFIGGVFFMISDLILSGTYFGEGKNRPVDVVTNHVTYYVAQMLIATSLLFI